MCCAWCRCGAPALALVFPALLALSVLLLALVCVGLLCGFPCLFCACPLPVRLCFLRGLSVPCCCLCLSVPFCACLFALSLVLPSPVCVPRSCLALWSVSPPAWSFCLSSCLGSSRRGLFSCPVSFCPVSSLVLSRVLSLVLSCLLAGRSFSKTRSAAFLQAVAWDFSA